MQKYNNLGSSEKLHYMSFAAHWLTTKPELIGEVKSDKELIERLDAFGKALYEYLNSNNAVKDNNCGSIGEARVSYSS